eukprot:7008157-Pyramimonas_sp.AAC.1
MAPSTLGRLARLIFALLIEKLARRTRTRGPRWHSRKNSSRVRKGARSLPVNRRTHQLVRFAGEHREQGPKECTKVAVDRYIPPPPNQPLTSP